MGLGYINTLILLPNFLQPDQLGLTKLLVQVSAMLAQFSALGFANMSYKFFPFFRNREKNHQGFLFLLFTVPTAGFILMAALLTIFRPLLIKYYAAEDAEILLRYYPYILLLTFFSLLYILQDAFLRSLYKTVISSFVQDVLLRVLTTISISLYAFDWIDFQQFVYLYIGINCGISLVLTGYLLLIKEFNLRPTMQAFKVRPFREILGYGLFSFIGNISSTIINNIDSLMILNYAGLAQVGIYQVAFFVTSAIRIPANSILKIAVPQVSDYWNQNNFTALKNLYQRVTSINLVIGCLLFIGIWANIDNLFSFMPPVYRKGQYVFFFLGLARLFDMATGINGIILITSEKFRYDLFFNAMLALITIGTNFYFIPRYGINGAAFAAMLAIVSINLARLLFVWAVYKMQPFVWKSLLITGIALGVYLASTFIPEMPNFIADMVVRSAFISIVYGVFILGLKASPDASESWRKIRLRFFKF